MASKYTALVEAKLAPGFAGKVQSELDKAKFKIKIEGLDSKTGSAASALSKGLNQVSTAAKKSKDETQKLNQELTKIRSSTLSNNIQAWMNRNTTAGKTFEAELKNIRSQLSNNTDPAMLKRCTAEFQNVQSKAKAAGLTLQSFASQFVNLGSATKNFMLQMAGLGSAYQIGMKTIGMVKEGIQTIVDLDTALIDLRKTTTMSGNELEDFYYDANEAAKQLGVTTRDIIQSAADWSRLGYSDKNSATTMAKLAAQFAAISPGMTIDSATTGLVSIMKAYGIEADEVLDGVMSKINRVGNTAATSNDQIINGLQNSASALAAMNTDLDKSIALFTAGQEIAQDDTKVGNALRSIALRIRGYDEETEELSQDLVNITGEVIDLTKVASNNYRGVSLFTDETQTEYKDVYDYLEGISEIWDELDAKTRQTLMEKLFGKNRANIGLAIIQNFDAARKAMAEMANSAGDADREMAIIMDSLEFKINRFKETGTGIWQNLVKRGDIGAIVDAGTKILDVIDKITGSIGLLGSALTTGAIVGVIKTIKAAGGVGLTTMFADMAAGVELFIEQLIVLAPTLASVATALLSIYEIGDRIKTVNTVGMLGEGHTIEEYEANVKELEKRVAEAQEEYDNLSLYDDGSSLSMAQDKLSLATIAVTNAQAEYQEALNNTSEAEKEASEQTKGFKENLESLSEETKDALLNLDAEPTEEQIQELIHWMDECGYSVDDLKQHLLELNGVASDSFSQTVQKNIGDLTSFRDELAATSQALADYNTAMEGGEKGDAIASMQEIYKGAMDDLTAGKIDSNRMHAAAKLFFSDEQLASMNYDMAEIGKQLQSSMLKTLFDPSGESAQSAGQRMIQYIKDNAAKFQDVAGVIDRGNGQVDFWYNSIKQLADAFGMSEQAMAGFLAEWDQYGVNVMQSTQDNIALIQQFQELKQHTDSEREAIKQLVSEMQAGGSDEFDIMRTLENLKQSGAIAASVDELKQIIQETNKQVDELDTNDANPEIKAQDHASSVIANVERRLASLNGRTATTYINTVEQSSGVKTSTTSSVGGSYSKAGSTSSNKALAKATYKARASGGRGGGTTLLNEGGAELVSDRGVAFIANGGEPGFVNLSKDAIVFNAEQTRKIFASSVGSAVSYALASGNAGNSLLNRFIGGFRTPAKRQAEGLTAKTSPVVSKAITSYTTKKKCPRCGSGVDESKSTCPYCGYNFTAGGYSTTMVKANVTSVNNGTGKVTTSTISSSGNGNGYNVISDLAARINASVSSGASTAYGGTVNYSRSYQSGTLYGGSQVIIGGSGGTSYGGSDVGGYTGSSGGDSIGSSSYQSQSDPEKVDWIAVAINRIQRVIADLQKVATSGFKKLSARLNASREEINEVTHEIDIMTKGYERYIQEANSVGLSEDLAAKVREGTIDINAYDESTRKLISEYQEWYEKALDCKSAVEGLNQQLAQLYTDNFANVQKDYENQLSLIEHDMNMINKDISMADSMGYLANAEQHQALMDAQKKDLEVLYQELHGLEAYMKEAMDSGTIDQNSEAWYDMNQQIISVKESIADANIEMVNLRKTIRTIKWNNFDYALEKFSQINDEAQFFIDLMSHSDLFGDNGQFNNKGTATAGLIALNYNADMAQADAYAKELLSVQKELEENPYDTEVIARRETLLGLQRQSILAAEGEKEAMKELVSDGISAELEALQELIDAYDESLDSAEDLYAYQKKISEKSDDVATIQKQLSAYLGDDSEETRATVQKLNESLKKAQTDLSDAEREQSISEQKKMLSDLYDEYQELMNNRLDNIDVLMREMIDYTNENLMDIRQTVKDVSRAVGYTPTNELMNGVSSNMANYDRVFEGISSANVVLNHIYENVNAMARAAGAVKSFATGGMVDYNGLAIVHGANNNEMMLNAADTQRYLQASKIMRSIPMLNASRAKNLNLPGIGGGAGTMVDVGGVTVAIDHVQDYEDMLKQMRDDPKFEKLIEIITLDRAVGKSGFRKNMINF